MTDHPMFLEYDWTSNTYRARLGDALMSIEHSFGTLAAARHALRLVGLRIGAKTDRRTWRIEFMEPVAERADAFRLGSWANRNREWGTNSTAQFVTSPLVPDRRHSRPRSGNSLSWALAREMVEHSARPQAFR
jgi:hypothetical protein